MFIHKTQAESRLGSARQLHTPVIWGRECPWDGHRVAGLGRLGPQVNLGIVSYLPGLSPPPPPPPLQACAGFLSQSSCVLVVSKTVGGGQEAR